MKKNGLKKATVSRLVENIINQIEEGIADGAFKAGEKLPSPQELMENFGVSRGTLREALKVLEQKGLLQLKPGVGGGAIVKEIGTEQISQNLAFLIRYQQISLEHITEFREGVESIVAGMAANRAKKEDIAYLRKIVDRAEQCAKKGLSHWETFLKIDQEFHLALAQISKNPLHIPMLEAIHGNIHNYYLDYLPINKKVMQENFKDMKDMFEAISLGNQPVACDLAYKHVRRFFKRMKPRAN